MPHKENCTDRGELGVDGEGNDFCMNCGEVIKFNEDQAIIQAKFLSEKIKKCRIFDEYPSKILILSIINSGVAKELKWKLNEIMAIDLHEKNQRAIVLMIQSRDWLLYLYDLSLKNGEWQIDRLIPLAWEFTKIGYSLFLSEEVKELIKDVN